MDLAAVEDSDPRFTDGRHQGQIGQRRCLLWPGGRIGRRIGVVEHDGDTGVSGNHPPRSRKSPVGSGTVRRRASRTPARPHLIDAGAVQFGGEVVDFEVDADEVDVSRCPNPGLADLVRFHCLTRPPIVDLPRVEPRGVGVPVGEGVEPAPSSTACVGPAAAACRSARSSKTDPTGNEQSQPPAFRMGPGSPDRRDRASGRICSAEPIPEDPGVIERLMRSAMRRGAERRAAGSVLVHALDDAVPTPRRATGSFSDVAVPVMEWCRHRGTPGASAVAGGGMFRLWTVIPCRCPGLSARNATHTSSPGSRFTVSAHRGLPFAGMPLRCRISSW